MVLSREETIRNGLSIARELTLEAARNPLFQVLGFCVAVELLQRIHVGDKPVISDMLGNVLETIVVSGQALNAVTSTVGGLVNPLKDISGALAPLFKS
jgi:hypothetical protein